ncbi:MAG: response regulator [Nitrospiraceae bacterium]|nr:response regulator [Nitrospiraceae bacterium]
MARELVLVIEDDADIRELARYNLAREGYRVIEAVSGEEGLELARKQVPDIVLLDLMLPNMDGLEVCKRIRSEDEASGISIVMVTAKGEESDIVAGLEVGADDYIAKPFSPRVLIARVRAVLRRTGQTVAAENDVLKVHNLVIHPARHEVLMDGKPIELTATEFRVLQYLARRPGWVRTRYQIVDAVHGEEYPVSDRSVDVQIAGLRKKLGQNGKLIETVHGVGYRFKE